MKRRTLLYLTIAVVLAMCVAAVFAACRDRAPEKPVLAVSIEPQRYLLERIAGNKFDVVSLLSANADPELYDPSVSNLLLLQKSRIYFRVGTIGFEQASLAKISENCPDLKIVDTSAGIKRAEGTHGGPHGYDPHIWTSVRNARVMARNMYDAVVVADPKNKCYYHRQWRTLDRDLASLDTTLSALLKPYRGSSFVIKHPSLTYFARDYGLEQIPLEINGKEPSPRDMKMRMDLIKKSGPVTFFLESGHAAAPQRSLASELGIPTAEISLLQYDWKQNILSVADAIAAGAAAKAQ